MPSGPESENFRNSGHRLQTPAAVGINKILPRPVIYCSAAVAARYDATANSILAFCPSASSLIFPGLPSLGRFLPAVVVLFYRHRLDPLERNLPSSLRCIDTRYGHWYNIPVALGSRAKSMAASVRKSNHGLGPSTATAASVIKRERKCCTFLLCLQLLPLVCNGQFRLLI